MEFLKGNAGRLSIPASRLEYLNVVVVVVVCDHDARARACLPCLPALPALCVLCWPRACAMPAPWPRSRLPPGAAGCR
jgi:hypothetical protein